MSRRKDDTLDDIQLFIQLLRLVLYIAMAVWSIHIALTHHPPSSLDLLVGVEAHSTESALVNWYERDDGRLFDVTANRREQMFDDLPPVAGVASLRDGTLEFVFVRADGYWYGPADGEQIKLEVNPEVFRIIDVATHQNGQDVVALCQRISDGGYSDCLGEYKWNFPEIEGETPVGVSWGDDTGDKPQLWCLALKPEGDDDKFEAAVKC